MNFPEAPGPALGEDSEAERLRKLFELLPVGVWMTDARGNIILSNEAGRRIWAGARYVGIEGYGEYKGWWPDGRPIAAEDWPAARAIAHGETRINDEIEIECFDGTRKTIRHCAAPIHDAHGRLLGAFVTNEDVTERRHAERALQASHERYEIVAKATNDAVWDWDLLAGTVRWNAGYQTLFGYGAEETKPGPESWYDHIHPEDKERVVASIHAVLDGGGQAWSAEYRFRRRDGAYAEVFDRGFVVRDEGARAVRMIGAMVDMTERKRAEAERARIGRMYASLTALNELVARAKSPAELLQGACDIAVASGEFSYALARMVGEDKRVAHVVAHSGARYPSWLERPLELDPASPDTGSVVARALAAGSPVIATGEAMQASAFLRRFAGDTGTQAAGAYPLWRGQACAGALLLCSGNASAFEGEMHGLLERMARDVSHGLDALAADEALQRFRLALDQSGDMVVLIDCENLRYVDVNDTYCRLLGYRREEVVGQDVTKFVTTPRQELEASYAALLADPEGTGSQQGQYRRKDGALIPFESTRRVVRSGGRAMIVAVSRDVTERKRYESRIEHLANFDALTDLPNRNLLRDRVEQAIAHARRTGGHVGLMFVDLDQFKLVNDSWGHAAGDALLLEVARRLQATVREGDTVARLGGDEFVVLCPDLARPGDAALVAEKIAAALAQPGRVDGREMQTSASIGISLFPGDGADLDSLLQCADAAMYRAKEAGRDGYQFYSAEMSAQARARVETEAGLRQAIERGELRLHYQPQVELATGQVRGFEALMRWEQPGRGIVSPAAFVPVAEESGLIVPMGRWALAEACRQAAAWKAEGLGTLKVAVNLSARQFWHGGVTEAVRAALEASGLAPEQLEVEITESVVARDLRQVMLSLEQLRRTGITVAIDDFGTGYSSLAYLRSLPIGKVKIDKSFIEGIPGDAQASALVAEIVRLAHVLSLHVVAEGVETIEQARFLREAGCEAMQGYLFARPLPAADCAGLLRSGRRLRVSMP
jgi:diguanylate cyclase (GGDEF)-like protein/PAS domain S-box-containing protein